MASDIHLDVPFVTQMKVGAHTGGAYYNDTTGCWYAGVCMLGYYRAAGPRLGVPEQYTIVKKMRGPDDKLLKETRMAAEPMGARYEQLKTNEGLVTVPLPGDKKWDCETLCRQLQEKGPLFVRRGFRDKKGDLVGGHIIVLVGCKISKQIVIYHCPTLGPDLEMSIDEFNSVFKWDDARAKDYSMMYLPPARETGRSVKSLVGAFGG